MLFTVGWMNEVYRIPPDYYWTNGVDRYHKFGFRHQFLNNKLEKYDPALTENQNCKNNGLYKIYDCGKIKYLITNNIQ